MSDPGEGRIAHLAPARSWQAVNAPPGCESSWFENAPVPTPAASPTTTPSTG